MLHLRAGTPAEYQRELSRLSMNLAQLQEEDRRRKDSNRSVWVDMLTAAAHGLTHPGVPAPSATRAHMFVLGLDPLDGDSFFHSPELVCAYVYVVSSQVLTLKTLGGRRPPKGTDKIYDLLDRLLRRRRHALKWVLYGWPRPWLAASWLPAKPCKLPALSCVPSLPPNIFQYKMQGLEAACSKPASFLLHALVAVSAAPGFALAS